MVSANQVTTPALSATVTVSSAFSADAVARVTAALVAYVQTVPIGGTVLPGSVGKVLLSELYSVVMGQQGVLNVLFTSLSGDIILSQDDVWSPLITVAMVIAP